MLNKDEMENIEKIKKMLNFTTEGTSLKINNEVSKLLLKYINNLEQTNKILDTECNRLEQKESILDKVTDKLKETIKKERQLMPYLPHKLASFHYANGREVLSKEILNIIEGGNNGK